MNRQTTALSPQAWDVLYIKHEDLNPKCPCVIKHCSFIRKCCDCHLWNSFTGIILSCVERVKCRQHFSMHCINKVHQNRKLVTHCHTVSINGNGEHSRMHAQLWHMRYLSVVCRIYDCSIHHLGMGCATDCTTQTWYVSADNYFCQTSNSLANCQHALDGCQQGWQRILDTAFIQLTQTLYCCHQSNAMLGHARDMVRVAIISITWNIANGLITMSSAEVPSSHSELIG